MKTTGLVLLLLTSFSVAAQTNPAPACCRHPLRVFASQTTVDLDPLFHWWKEHSQSNQTGANLAGSRPLVAWQRINGFKTAVIGSDWVVNAIVQSAPADTNSTPQAIILKNPPAAEEAWYYELKRRLAAAAQQITADQHTYDAEIRAAEKAEAGARAADQARTDAGSYYGTGKWAVRDRADNNRQQPATGGQAPGRSGGGVEGSKGIAGGVSQGAKGARRHARRGRPLSG